MSYEQQRSDDSHEPSDGPSRAARNSTMQIFGPLLAGFAIDAIDLITFGPIGLYTGMIIGGTVGYLLAPYLGFPKQKWWVSSLLTGIYCTLPLTAFLPAATFAVLVSRLITSRPAPEASGQDPALRKEGSIEIDYEVIDEDAEHR